MVQLVHWIVFYSARKHNGLSSICWSKVHVATVLDFVLTWLHSYLTVCLRDYTVNWLCAYWTIQLLDCVLTWLYSYLTVCLLEYTVTCSTHIPLPTPFFAGCQDLLVPHGERTSDFAQCTHDHNKPSAIKIGHLPLKLLIILPSRFLVPSISGKLCVWGLSADGVRVWLGWPRGRGPADWHWCLRYLLFCF